VRAPVIVSLELMASPSRSSPDARPGRVPVHSHSSLRTGWGACGPSRPLASATRQNGPVARRPVHSESHPGEPGGDEKPVDRRRQVTLVGVAVAVILLVWFALANTRKVQIDFWVFNRQAPLILVIVISGLLGALIGALIMRRRQRD